MNFLLKNKKNKKKTLETTPKSWKKYIAHIDKKNTYYEIKLSKYIDEKIVNQCNIKQQETKTQCSCRDWNTLWRLRQLLVFLLQAPNWDVSTFKSCLKLKQSVLAKDTLMFKSDACAKTTNAIIINV